LDTEVYWKKGQSLNTLEQLKTTLVNVYQNWSMLLDIQIDNPTANTNYPRILFSRGATLNTSSETYNDSDTILKIAPAFNMIMYLDRMTNDLNVSVQTNSKDMTTMKTITVPNLPVGQAVRIGVMVGTKVLEVYINGKLYKSITYEQGLKDIKGNIQPPSDAIISQTARVRNLRLFSYPLSPSHFRAYGSAEAFEHKPIPDSCSA
jgi:hypothetical protein